MKVRPHLSAGLAAILLTALPVAVQAGDKFASKQEIETGGTIGFQSITPVTNGKNGNATTYFTLSPYVGYFPIDGFEIGILSSVAIVTPSGSNSVSDIRIFLAPAYNFHMQESIVTPFIEGLVGLAARNSGNNTVSGFSYGGRGGVKVDVTGKGLLTMDVRYLMITEKPSNASNRYGSNELSLNLGFTVWFN